VTRLIELDVAEPWEPPERARPRSPGRVAVAVVLVLVAALGLVTGAQRARPIGPVLELAGMQWAIVTGRTVFALHQPDQDGTELDAYRLPVGENSDRNRAERLWAARLPDNTTLVYGDDEQVVLGGAAGNSTMAGFDAQTGRKLWTRTGLTATVLNGGVVVGQTDEGPRPIEADHSDQELAGLDPATGATRWRFSTPAGVRTAYIGSATALRQRLELNLDNTVRIRDLRTGALVRSFRLADDEPVGGLSTLGDLLVAARGADEGGSTITAYNLTNGSVVWRVTDAGVGGSVRDCGPVLCLFRPDSIAGVDRETARERWRIDSRDSVSRVDDHHILLGEGLGTLVDTATGQVVGTRPPWTAVWAAQNADVVWRRDGEDTVVVGLRGHGSTAVTAFGVIRDWTGRFDCFSGGAFYACVNAPHLYVWRLPIDGSGRTMI
jgi:outer membrane protein assembly factor BamB